MDTATQTPATDANSQPASTAPASADTLLTATPATAQSEAAPTAAQPANGQAPATAEAQAAGTDKPTDEKPQGAPETYADFALPEGMAFDGEVLDEFKAMAKERNLSQEDAQKFTDLGAKLVQQSHAKTLAQIEATQAQWAEASRTDKEFGGDNLGENVAVAKRALDTFGSPELSQMLKESGLGNHPEIIRAFYRVGKAISEDKLVSGTTRPSETDVAKKLYPTMTN